MLYDSILAGIGRTPLCRLSRFEAVTGAAAQLFGKAERANPGGSVKDRAALWMIEAAERDGLLEPGGTIVEPTSGNTGIGLACVAAVKGYRMILTMPESMSLERRMLLAAYGAQLVLTPAAQGMQGAVDRAKEIAGEVGGFMPMQFDNPANPAAHEATTAAELMEDMEGIIDALVATIGTGGTVTGIGRALKRKIPGARIIGVEPEESPMITRGKSGPHGIQGTGANFVPGNYDPAVVDAVRTVSTPRAYECARLLPRTEGLLCGISSGAALAAAIEVAAEMPGARIAVILPDTGERYLSTPLFKEE